MQKIILNVAPEVHEALLAHRKKTGCPISVFVRRAIAAALASEPPDETPIHEGD